MFIGFVVMSLGVAGLHCSREPERVRPRADVGGARAPPTSPGSPTRVVHRRDRRLPSRGFAGRRVPRRPRPRRDRDADHDRHLVRRARPRISSARAAIGERVQARKAAAQDKARAKLEKQRIKDERAAAKAEEAQDAGKGPRAPGSKASKRKLSSGWGSPSPSSCCRSRSPSARSIRLVRPDEGAAVAPTSPGAARSRRPTAPTGSPRSTFLRAAPPSTNDGVHEKDIMEALGHTLSTFGVDARVIAAHRGPTVTMYEVAVASGTKVNKVLNLSSDIAYALATPTCASSRRSRASRRSASRFRTAIATS